MPFARPTLTQLRNQVASDIATNLPGADALLRFSNLKVLGKAQAGLAQGHYGYMDWISKEAVPFTATAEFLEGWAGLKGVVRRAAASASGTVTFTGINGTDIPAGTPVVRGDGVSYLTQADVVVSSGTAVVTVTAVVPAAASNADPGTVMTLGTAIPGVQSGGTVTSGLTGGSDVESNDSLRSRMLQVYAAPPQGGDLTDYIEWALSVTGVTRAWVLPNGMGPGTVVVYAMLDQAEVAHGGFPQGSDGVAAAEPRAVAATGDQLAVANYILARQPVTALVYSVAPTANVVPFTIDGIATASTDVKNQIAAAISGVFLREGGPGGAFDGNRTVQGTVELSFIEAAIAAITGTTGFVITTPAGNITSGAGAIPTIGTVTYT